MASFKTNLKAPSAQKSMKEKMAEVVDECKKYKQLCEKSTKELEDTKARHAKLEVDLSLNSKKLTQLEGDFEAQNSKLRSTLEKLEETSKTATECERQRRYLETRVTQDEEKLQDLEQYVRESSEVAMDSERRYDDMSLMSSSYDDTDVSRKLLMTEAELERAEARAEAAAEKLKNLQEDLKSLTGKLKTGQARSDRASKKEELFDKAMEDLRAQLAKAEHRGSESDKQIAKLQREIDIMQDEVLQTKMQYQTLREELDPYSREIRAS